MKKHLLTVLGFLLAGMVGGAARPCMAQIVQAAVALAAHTAVSVNSISASPNPIQVCDGTNAGDTTLTWNSEATFTVEVHMDNPAGPVFARTGPGPQSASTGNWVTNGRTFYLQDVSGGKTLTYANTLGTVTVNVTKEGCTAYGFISADPNPVQVCDGSGKGATTVSWNSAFTSTVEVHLDSPGGTLFSRTGPGSHAFVTGNWVTNGRKFFLQDVSGGKPLTEANSLGSVAVGLTTNGCQANGSISANPNPISTCAPSGTGITTLSWTSSNTATVEVHVGSPTGTLFSRTGPGQRSASTGKWVTNGTKFYLQDVSGGKPLTAANTLGTVIVEVNSNVCS